MRSKLFVPGARPELFGKALAGPADAISIDLEDSVAEDRKAEARLQVGEFLRSSTVRTSGKIIIVRVNALSSSHFTSDVLAVAVPGLSFLNLPKAQSPDEVRAAALALEHAESVNRVEQPIAILANIETPLALRRAAEIAAAHPRVAGLQLGLADLFEASGIDRGDAANVHAAMFAMRLAAAEAGVFAYDGAFARLQDPEGYRAEAGMARRLGYLGKSCIHPSQVALANEVFQPRDEEIAFARRVVATAQQTKSGVFTLDGRMIDAPFIRRAEALVALVDKQGRGDHE